MEPERCPECYCLLYSAATDKLDDNGVGEHECFFMGSWKDNRVVKEEANKLLLDHLAAAIIGGISITTIGLIFPAETRKRAVAALRVAGYEEAARFVESMTNETHFGSL